MVGSWCVRAATVRADRWFARTMIAKLRQHRAALEAGADPKIVTGWMTETLARRTEAETRLRPGAQRQTMTAEQIADQIAQIDDIPAALASADPKDKAQLYGQLGLTMTYNPDPSVVRVTVLLLSDMYVRGCPRGDLNSH
jgi:site-specific DNA recombinase